MRPLPFIAALILALAAPACGPRRLPGPRAAADADGGWRTLRAEHLVTVDSAGKGGRERRTMRAVIAVARPDRFRLRALGPAGITLFDLLYRGGEVTVLRALRDPSSSDLLGRVIAAMAGDLAAAYGLGPSPPGRTVERGPDRLVVREPGREVQLDDFFRLGGKVTAARITVDNRQIDYRVEVVVSEVVLDEALSEELFTLPSP